MGGVLRGGAGEGAGTMRAKRPASSSTELSSPWSWPRAHCRHHTMPPSRGLTTKLCVLLFQPAPLLVGVTPGG